MDRILITGTHSDCGKTTVTCALLKVFKEKGFKPAAFKCGPDYIDPLFHRQVMGVPSYNLDPFFCSAKQLNNLIAKHAGEISLLEGVMGYYDGISADGYCSTYDIACQTQTPAVLVLDTKGMYTSAAAVLQGFLNFKEPSNIKGVIFNNTSPMLYEGLYSLAEKTGIRPLGFLPGEAKIALKSRHLGLVPAHETPDIEEKLTLLGTLAKQYIDIDSLIALAACTPAIKADSPDITPLGSVRIAVAWDEAFCFLYEENLELLKALGAEIVFFRPLHDNFLPDNIGGLYLSGGYPELHLAKLSANTSMLKAINTAIQNGMPTIAESGGFLYLHDMLDSFPMAGVIHAKAYKTEKLGRFGYITLHAQKDNLLCPAGNNLRAHEFHYYESTDCGDSFIAQKPLSAKSWACVHTSPTLYAGFPHLYLEANPVFAQNFVGKAIEYGFRKFT